MTDTPSPATLEWKLRLDRLADEYETEWRAGGGPRIEEFLDRVADDDRLWLLEELLLVDLDLHDVGDPRADEIADYRRRFADCRGVVDRAVQQHLAGESLLDFQRPPTGSQPIAAPDDFGDFTQLELLARGGMGTVYRARQTSLGRIVALKLLHEGFDDDPDRVARFQAEARAAARLRHPHIVTVHEFGQRHRRPYLAMDLIEGQTLAERIKQGPLAPREAASLLRDVADAVSFAHRQGVIHRDLKPSNILLDRQQRALVTDFGLARQADASPQLTSTGVLLGTPSYMAPELISGEAPAAESADIYALGATLYAALTGRPPFQAASALDTLLQATLHEPPPPREINPAIPRDLETICLKCLEKTPPRRYASAADLSSDLKAFLEGRTIVARRPAWWERALRWRRRHPAIATLLASALLGLALLVGGSTWAAKVFQRQRNEARDARDDARHMLWQAKINEAESLAAVRKPGHRAAAFRLVREALDLAPANQLSPEELLSARSVVASASLLADLETVRTWQPADAVVDGWSNTFDFDAALQRYVILTRSGGVSLRNLADDREVTRLPTDGPQARVYLGPSGKRLAVVQVLPATERLDVWDASAAPPRKVGEFSGQFGKYLEFSPNDRRLAFHELGAGLRVVDLDTHQNQTFAHSTDDDYRPLAFDAQGQRIAYGDHNLLRLGDLNTGKESAQIPLVDAIESISWHPSGQALVVGVQTPELQFIDLLQPKASFPWRGPMVRGLTVSFFGRGDRLISNDWSNRARLWDVAGRQELLAFTSFGRVFQIDAQDTFLAAPTASIVDLRLLKLFDPRGSHVLRLTSSQSTFADYAALSPVDPIACAWAVDRDTGKWGLAMHDTTTGKAVATVRHPGSRPLRFLDDGSLLTFGSKGLFRWPRTQGETARDLRFGPPVRVGAPLKSIYLPASSSSGAVLATADNTPRIDVVVDGDPPQTIDTGMDQVRGIAVSPDGRWVAAARFDAPLGPDVVKVYSVHDGRLEASLAVPASPHLQFSGDGSRLACIPSVRGEHVVVWSVGDWQRQATYEGVALAEDRQGRLFATSDTHGAITLSDQATGDTLCRLHLPGEETLAVRDFSHDGSFLLVNSTRYACNRLMDLRQVRAQLAEMGLDWEQPDYPSADERPLNVTWLLHPDDPPAP